MQTDIQRDRARSMRKNMPMAERKLWAALRGRNCEGFRFNRQVEVGPYIVDFLCRERAVVVEVDGATHSETLEIAYDTGRSAFLEAKGFAIFRCMNIDVYENLDGVIASLLLVLEAQQPKFRRRTC